MTETLTKDGKCWSWLNCDGLEYVQPWTENLRTCVFNVDCVCTNPIGIEFIQKEENKTK